MFLLNKVFKKGDNMKNQDICEKDIYMKLKADIIGAEKDRGSEMFMDMKYAMDARENKRFIEEFFEDNLSRSGTPIQ